MRLRPRRRRRSRSARKLPPRRSSRWRWLGLGALALGVAALLRREPRPSPPPEAAAEPPEAAAKPPEVPQPPDDVDRCWIAGPAGTLRVLERHPDGRLPIVFIHGLGGRAEHWAAQLTAAGPAIRAVAFDLPGHGRSDRAADGDDSIGAAAAAIGAVLDGLGIRRSVLVAHSLGAAAAIDYAARHGRRVAALLLVDPSGDQTRLPPAQRRELLAQLSRDPEEEIAWYFRQLLTGARAEVADRVLEDLASVPTDVVLSALEAGTAYSPAAALERFGGPVHCLISDLNDLPYSLHRLRPDLPAMRFPGASHWLMLDRPEEVWSALVDLLDATDRGADSSDRAKA